MIFDQKLYFSYNRKTGVLLFRETFVKYAEKKIIKVIA